MARAKELNFFVARGSWAKGVDWYAAQFDGRATVRGESSPAYTNYPVHDGVPARMHSVVPDAKLIFLVRDPIERIVSQYIHDYSAGKVDRPIDETLAAGISAHPYVMRSKYFLQLEQYLAFFPREQILVLAQEDLLHDRAPTMSQVFEFLEVDPLPIQVPHEKQRFLPQVRLVIDSKDCATHEALEPGDIVIDNPNLGRQVIRRPSRVCREQFERYVEMAAPLTLPPSERGRLFSEYFEAFLPPFEEILDRHITQWRDP